MLRPEIAKSLPCWLSQYRKAELRQPTGQRLSNDRTQQKKIRLSQPYFYIMRKVRYHQIWIQNYFGFIVLILVYTYMYICRLRLYDSDITTRKKWYHIVKVIQVYSWFLYHIFRCIIWRGVAYFEKLPPAVILLMLSDKMVSQSLHFWLLILGTGKSIHTKYISTKKLRHDGLD